MINYPDLAVAELLKVGTVIALEDFNQFAVVENAIAGLLFRHTTANCGQLVL